LAERNTRRAKSRDGEPDNVFLLGDFNIFNQKGDKTLAALTDAGFVVPEEITKLPSGSNLAGDKYYDQIAYLDPKNKLRSTRKAGVLNFLAAIYGDDDHVAYGSDMQLTDGNKYSSAANKLKYFKQWRTFQVSDHFPLWLELQIDYSEGYLVTRGRFGSKRQVATATSHTTAVSNPTDDL